MTMSPKQIMEEIHFIFRQSYANGHTLADEINRCRITDDRQTRKYHKCCSEISERPQTSLWNLVSSEARSTHSYRQCVPFSPSFSLDLITEICLFNTVNLSCVYLYKNMNSTYKNHQKETIKRKRAL